MDYCEATGVILRDFEQKPQGLEMLMQAENVSRYEAMRMTTALIASNFVLEGQVARPGQLAQELSGWHSILRGQCEAKYRELTTAGGLSREVANEDPALLTLQAIRRGVRDAMNHRYNWAHNARQARHTRYIQRQV